MNYDLEKIVDNAFLKIQREGILTVNTEQVVKNFFLQLKEIEDKEFIHILITSGYIPDLYEIDSREETLYTRLCEALVVEWANRMGFNSNIVTQKSSYEDVIININNNIIISDVKSFRLTRSQAAPNVKDFVKPEDYTKWSNRHESNKIGGLVIYPQLHEWSKSSDAYLYCSNKQNPILMLPYHYLAYLLDTKNRLNFDINLILNLWDYDSMFTSSIRDKEIYWKTINNKILEITGDTKEIMKQFLYHSDNLMYQYVILKKEYIKENREVNINKITEQVNALDEAELREIYLNYKIAQETDYLLILEDRIEQFRLENNNTKYHKYIDKLF